jgi:CheY-like chemotaxis protein
LESVEKLANALRISVSTLVDDVSESLPEKSNNSKLLADELVDILFVEDNSDDIQLTLQALKAARITNRIHTVRDGAEALDFLYCTGSYAHRQMNNRPQIILLDLDLPKVSGLEVLRRVKSDPKTRTIPVLVLTASRQHRDFVASKQLGADGYIVKPVDFQNLSEVTPQLCMQWALLKPAAALNS